MSKKSPSTKKAAPKKQAAKPAKDRNTKGQFVEGNTAAEKWTEQTVMEKLQQMWEYLTFNPDIEEDDPDFVKKNVVRANDIKLAGEIRLMAGVTKQQWNEWKEKFKDNDSVSDLIDNIDTILEARLIYSGSGMDQFVLSNHYEYRHKQDTTSNGKETGTAGSFLELLKAASQLSQ